MKPYGALEMFVIYDHPKDYPDEYVVRRWTVLHGIQKQEIVDRSRDIDWLRRRQIEAGRAMLFRDPDDDPAILEVWL